MEGKDYWLEFTQSGKVEAYLQYCLQACKREQDKERTANQEKEYAGFRYSDGNCSETGGCR